MDSKLVRLLEVAAGFFGWWLFAHLSLAFVTLEWSDFTDWSPLARAVNLFLAFWAGLFVHIIQWSKGGSDGR